MNEENVKDVVRENDYPYLIGASLDALSEAGYK